MEEVKTVRILNTSTSTSTSANQLNSKGQKSRKEFSEPNSAISERTDQDFRQDGWLEA